METLNLKFFQDRLDKLVLRKDKKLESIVIWLIDILSEIDIDSNILMPQKANMAKLLKVGLGTVQNAYRRLEDKGLLLSKQCVGTFLIPEGSDKNIKKLTSKKDKIFSEFKEYILKSDLKVGDKLKSVRYYSKRINISTALVLQIFNQLEADNIVENVKGERVIKSLDFKVLANKKETLCDKIYSELKVYIADNFKIGDKLPAISVLSEYFNVSPKTVYSVIKLLQKDGVLKPRSGRYGTVITKIPDDKVFYQKPETSIFAPSSEMFRYHYEKILNTIRKMIYDNFEIGSKLPSISELSLLLDVNPNTVRKCFDVLRAEGVVTSVRGRYGGTFVVELPDIDSVQTYQWLAVNTDF